MFPKSSEIFEIILLSFINEQNLSSKVIINNFTWKNDTLILMN